MSSHILSLLLCVALYCSNTPTPARAEHVAWIWGRDAHAADRDLFVRREFELRPDLRQATLHAVADFHRLHVYLNGERIAETDYGDPAFRRDVTRLLVRGGNVLAAHCRDPHGPAAVALRLELEFSDGRRQVIATSNDWQASSQAATGWQRTGFEPPAAWPAARSLGTVAEELWSDPVRDTGVLATDDYHQWKQALQSDMPGDVSKFFVPEGYVIERLKTADSEEGSWVSLEFDPQGRLIVAREDKGLLRMTLPTGGGAIEVETINETLEECRGLLCAHESLYVNANNSKALYRLRDTDGDDRYDETTLLYESGGTVGHGRNDLALGPDGRVYAIHGDAVELPTNFADRTSPFREHRRGEKTREGYLLGFDPDGGHPELIAAGLRNPYGIDFHPDGDAFTYDADAEFDMGAPWYRPTRIDALVSGADFGWRGVTGSWPPYYPDRPGNAAPTLDIGKGSPTGVKFGTHSRFPPRDRRALFVLDWAYGRIVAVRFIPHGGTYRARAETFIKGRPLNVTDLGFGPDGAMYVVTGGRKTQAALYRIHYSGPDIEELPLTPQQEARAAFSAQQRELRRQLESFHGRDDQAAVSVAWPHLNHPDHSIRYAARIAIEHQPVETWWERALQEQRPVAAATALMALARSGRDDLKPRILHRLNNLPLKELPVRSRQAAVYTYRLCLLDGDGLDRTPRAQTVQRLDALFPTDHEYVNQELSRLLVLLEAPQAVSKTLALLRTATDQAERLHYFFVLRDAQAGWDASKRREYFLAVRQMRGFAGGEGMPRFIRQIEADALAALSESEREQYEPLLASSAETAAAQPVEPRPFVRKWSLGDLDELLSRKTGARDLQRGARLFTEALCVRCHRVGTLGSAVGPDLTAVASRFSRRDILRSILDPSDVVAEQYRRTQIITTDGRTIVGQIIPNRDYRSSELLISADPLQPGEVITIAKPEVEELITSQTSVMPVGLFDTLTPAEILDLLAWLEAGGSSEMPDRQR